MLSGGTDIRSTLYTCLIVAQMSTLPYILRSMVAQISVPPYIHAQWWRRYLRRLIYTLNGGADIQYIEKLRFPATQLQIFLPLHSYFDSR